MARRTILVWKLCIVSILRLMCEVKSDLTDYELCRLAMFQPLISLCRCPSDHTCRPVFNWIHWFLGTVAMVLSSECSIADHWLKWGWGSVQFAADVEVKLWLFVPCLVVPWHCCGLPYWHKEAVVWSSSVLSLLLYPRIMVAEPKKHLLSSCFSCYISWFAFYWIRSFVYSIE